MIPIKRTDELFMLIKSLSKNERRYFRLFSGLQEGQKTYLMLFDALDKEQEYNQKQFVKKYKGQSFLKNLAWRKHHLYDTILSALELYHTSPESEIYSLMHRAGILYDKGFYKQAIKLVVRAKQLAHKYELFGLLLEILRMEEMSAIKLADAARQSNIASELTQAHKLLNNAVEHKQMLNAVYQVYHSTGVFRKKKDEEKLAHVLRSRLWKNESEAYSLKAKRYYYHAQFLYGYMKGDSEHGYRFSLKNANTFFDDPGQIKLQPQIYLNALNALLHCCASLKRYDEMIGFIHAFKQTRKHFTENHQGSAILLSYHELDYYISTGQLSDGYAAARQIERDLQENEFALSSLERTGLQINLSLMYFFNERYRETLSLLNRVLEEPVLESRVDMDAGSRIFYLIVHYERGAGKNFMKGLVRSTYRRLRKYNSLNKFESIILEFIRRRLARVKNEEQLMAALTALRTMLENMKDDPYEYRALEFFDLVSWLTAKIEGKKFADVVRQKAD